MYFSLCFVLFLASCGFSGVQSYATFRFPGSADDYGSVNRPGKDSFLNYDVYNDDSDSIENANSNNGVSNKVQQPKLAFFSGGIFGVMGVLPPPKPSKQPSDDVYILREDKEDKMKEFDEKLKKSLKALDDLEKDVKARRPSKRFLQYD